MSPHAVLVDSTSPDVDVRSRSLLKNYFITRNAFLPESSPATSLADPYYQPWEDIAAALPRLIASGDIHDAVSQMPLLSTDRLANEAEWRRAYVLLGFMTHAYVWGGQTPRDVLPPQITIPFLAVSHHLELPPVLTYAAANLWNFTSTHPQADFSDIDALETLVSFTGTESERWFLLISVCMEARGARIIDIMLDALEAVKARDYDVIIAALRELANCIESVGVLLGRMDEKCDPMVFYHQIRPFLAGSKNMAAAGLPRGVFYDEGDGKGEWRQLRGGSNGQSSLIQFFDVVLGVDHTGKGTGPEERKETPPKDEKCFHAQVRDYMPGPHARFLTHVAQMGSIRQLACLESKSDEQSELQAAYTAATDALTEFRNVHIRIVSRYIVVPSRKPRPACLGGPVPGQKNLASSSDRSRKIEDLTGTGGTALMPFLKQTRDETKEAGSLLD